LLVVEVLVVELGEALVQALLDVVEDLDVLVQRRGLDVSQPLRRRVRRGDSGRLGLFGGLAVHHGARYRTLADRCANVAAVASVKQCRSALDRLAKTLDGVDPELRARHLPQRTVACRVKDLDVLFTARVDDAGVHDICEVSSSEPSPPQADVRLALDSDDLIALVNREDDFVSAWLHGRVQVSAPMRDMLRLRSVLGL
jgi:predicted lipid carrier protein YhbT